MATDGNRAPRVVGARTSMAAASAALSGPHGRTNTDFAAAWVLAWQACGGTLTIDGQGRRSIGRTYNDAFEPVYQCIGRNVLAFRTEGELTGALQALAAVLSMAGRAAMDAVFALADGPGGLN